MRCESDHCDNCVRKLYADWMHILDIGEWKGTYLRRVNSHPHLLLSSKLNEAQSEDHSDEEQDSNPEEEENEQIYYQKSP